MAAKAPAVVKDEQKALVAATDLDMLEADAGVGQETLTSHDLSIPYIYILQSNSPQINKRHGKYVEGAEIGMFFNNVTQEIWDGEKGIYVILCAYQKRFTEWVPRDKGGGLVMDHGSDDSILKNTSKNEKKKDVLSNGNEIVASGTHYIILYDPETGKTGKAVISLSSTQLKKSRTWNSLWTGIQLKNKEGRFFTPPCFYNIWKITTVPESNDQGNWMGFKIESWKPVIEVEGGRDIYMLAREFHDQISKGLVQAAAPADQEAVGDMDKPAF